ncbi:TPA: hypothetical protein ACF3WV_001565 [Enterococcus hirae]
MTEIKGKSFTQTVFPAGPVLTNKNGSMALPHCFVLTVQQKPIGKLVLCSGALFFEIKVVGSAVVDKP